MTLETQQDMADIESRPRQYMPSYSLPTSTSQAKLLTSQSNSARDSIVKPATSHDRQRRRTTTLHDATAQKGVTSLLAARSRKSEAVQSVQHGESAAEPSRPPLTSMHRPNRRPISRLPTPIRDRAIVKDVLDDSYATENSTSQQHRLLGPLEPSITSSAKKPFTDSLPVSGVKSGCVPSRLHGDQAATHDLSQHVPTLYPRGLPRSSTYNVLSSLKSSLSKTSISGLTSSRLSIPSLSSVKPNNDRSDETPPTKSTSPIRPAAVRHRSGGVSVYGPPKSTFPGSHRLIDKALPTPQWIGRFTNLKDRFLNEMLDEATIQTRLPNIPIFLPLTVPEREASQKVVGRTRFDPSDRASSSRSPESAESSGIYNETFIHKKIFARLGAICITTEAQKSLRDFQQKFARREGKEELLPLGGTMSDRPGMLTRAGNYLIGNTGREQDRHGQVFDNPTSTARVQCANAFGEVDYRPRVPPHASRPANHHRSTSGV